MFRKAAAWTIGLICMMACAVGSAAGLELPPSDFTGAMQILSAGAVQENAYIEVCFSSPKAGGMDGTIKTSSNLELVGFSSAGISAQLSADSHVVTVFGDPVKYVYRVRGGAGEDVSVTLTGAECTDGAGGLYSMQDEAWVQTVLPAGEVQTLPAGMIEAAQLMSGPAEGSIPSGGTVEIVFTSPDGGGMDGRIHVSDNLIYEGMRSSDLGEQISAKDHVVSLFGEPVIYTYRVNADPGEEISVQLTGAKMADAQRNLYTVPEQEWSGTVGSPDEGSVVTPVDKPAVTPPPQSSGNEFMHGPEAAVAGRLVEIQITSPADGGLEAVLEVSENLTFEGLRGGFLSAELSTERKAVSLFGEALTYVYRVDAEPGEEVSVALIKGQQSDGNCSLFQVEPEQWVRTVAAADGSDETPEQFVAMMKVPEPAEVVAGNTVDVSFLSPVSGGMDGMVTTSANLKFEGVVSAGNGARISTDEEVKSLLGIPVTYRYRVTGSAGSPVYVRLTGGRMADAQSNLSMRVRNQIWMGVIKEETSGALSAAAGSGLRVVCGTNASAPGTYVTGAEKAQNGAALLTGLKTRDETAGISLINADGSAADLNGLVCTGQAVVVSQNGQAERVPVVVAGDVTGTGVLSVGQVVRTAAACAGWKPLTGAYLLAGDLNGNGAIDVGDLARLASMIRPA